MEFFNIFFQAIASGHPNVWGFLISLLVVSGICFVAWLRYQDRERDRALLMRADISPDAKAQIKENMATPPGGKLLLAFLIAGSIMSTLVRDEVLARSAEMSRSTIEVGTLVGLHLARISQ